MSSMAGSEEEEGPTTTTTKKPSGGGGGKTPNQKLKECCLKENVDPGCYDKVRTFTALLRGEVLRRPVGCFLGPSCLD